MCANMCVRTGAEVEVSEGKSSLSPLDSSSFTENRFAPSIV